MACSAVTPPPSHDLERIAVAVRDERVLDAARVCEVQPLRAEELHLLGPDAGRSQAVGPEAERVHRDGEVHSRDLVGPAAAHDPGLPERKAREDRSRVAVRVAVVQVVDGYLAVVEGRLLDAAQAEEAGVEVVVLLGRPHAERQMVVTSNEIHPAGLLP